MSRSVDEEDFFEIDGDIVVRQVTRTDDRYYCSLDDWAEGVGPLLTNQAVADQEFSADEEITAEEFERAWHRAIEQRDTT